jgi:3-methyladenine DNA glycosylase AlkC
MVDLVKDVYSAVFIAKLVKRIQSHHSDFNGVGFTGAVFDKTWLSLELKQRMRHISQCLRAFLPADYLEALAILKPVSVDFGQGMDFAPMIFPDFVETFGLDYVESLDALEHFTRYSSSEFAIRPFIAREPDLLIDLMYQWSHSDSYHVRRCASEGTRPRLPWAMALSSFKADPSPIIPILTRLRNDPELYVRRSVANSLNDIAKDNPAVVVALATKWLGENAEVDWLVRHGCRTLLKQGYPEVLALFGFVPPDHVSVGKVVLDNEVKQGGHCKFSFELTTARKHLGKLRIEYAINFMKANGKQARKVFKISELVIKGQVKQVTKVQSFRPISTRKYYVGVHGLVIIINGIDMHIESFSVV